MQTAPLTPASRERTSRRLGCRFSSPSSCMRSLSLPAEHMCLITSKPLQLQDRDCVCLLLHKLGPSARCTRYKAANAELLVLRHRKAKGSGSRYIPHSLISGWPAGYGKLSHSTRYVSLCPNDHQAACKEHADDSRTRRSSGGPRRVPQCVKLEGR